MSKKKSIIEAVKWFLPLAETENKAWHEGFMKGVTTFNPVEIYKYLSSVSEDGWKNEQHWGVIAYMIGQLFSLLVLYVSLASLKYMPLP